jgi:hypothetical protein
MDKRKGIKSRENKMQKDDNSMTHHLHQIEYVACHHVT